MVIAVPSSKRNEARSVLGSLEERARRENHSRVPEQSEQCLRGPSDAFEPHVFRTLENAGISGRLRRLGDGQELPSLQVNALRRFTFVNFDELFVESIRSGEMFYVPVQTNHISVDFYVPHLGLLVQVTVGQKHGVKASGLQEILSNDKLFSEWRKNHPGEKLRLVFLCDRFNFDQFTKQPYLSKGGTTLKEKKRLNELNKSFEQYAWELDVNQQLAAHLTHSPNQKKRRSAEKRDKEKMSHHRLPQR